VIERYLDRPRLFGCAWITTCGIERYLDRPRYVGYAWITTCVEVPSIRRDRGPARRHPSPGACGHRHAPSGWLGRGPVQEASGAIRTDPAPYANLDVADGTGSTPNRPATNARTT
jgi:hypothetical protein